MTSFLGAMGNSQFIIDLFLLGVAGTGLVLAVFYIKLRMKRLFGGFCKLKTQQNLAQISRKSEMAKSLSIWWPTSPRSKMRTQPVREFLGACESGRLADVRRFLKAGINVNVRRASGGKTGLMVASQNGHIEIVKYLLKVGARVNATGGKSGKTALIRASERKHHEIVGILVGCGAKVDFKSRTSGKTALMGAVASGDLEMVQLLIKAGADVNAKNRYEETPLDIAFKTGWDDLLELLKAYGAQFHKYAPQEQSGQEPADIDQYYAILRCKKTDGVEEIKANYRSLVKQYHPDVIQGKGLPADFVEFANEKFHQIREAYQHIIRKDSTA